ncbi:TPR repeat-containing protein [Candidatus Magnetomorum sp. HK-1]|nr:TPR repeat-containing protein [Candidatus Magnetomorum sp. HK-1]
MPQSKNVMHFNIGEYIDKKFFIFNISTGGMSEIYHCVDITINKPFALKTLRKELLYDKEVIDYLEREAYKWIKIGNHPNIVRCFSFNHYENLPFICLELIPINVGTSPDLSNLMKQKKLSIKESLQYVIDVALGMEYANKMIDNFKHLDLKPKNILIAPEQQAKVSDFGLSKINEKLNIIAGSPYYMAPELWKNEETDQRTDIYSLGCILFELLEGSPPFVSNSIEHVENMHMNYTIPKINNNVFYGLNELIEPCLMKRKEDRFSTFTDFIACISKVFYSFFETMPTIYYADNVINSRDHLNWGCSFDEMAKYNDAIIEFDKAIQMDQSYYLAYNNKGNTLNNLEKYKDAIEVLKKAIEIDSHKETAYYNFGLSYVGLGDTINAMLNINKALEINPKYSKALAGRGHIHFRNKNFKEAETDFLKSIEYDPSNFLANYSMGVLKEKNNELNEALHFLNIAEETGCYKCNIYLDRAIVHDKLNNINNAMSDYTKAITHRNQIVEAYYYRAKTYEDLSQPEKAIVDYSDFLSKKPNHPFAIDAMLSRAILINESGDIHTAIDEYSNILNIEPKNYKAICNRAVCWYDLKEYQKAINDYGKALQINPNCQVSYADRANAYGRLKKYDLALQDQTKLIELDPNNPLFYYNRSVTYELMEQLKEQFEDICVAIDLDNNLAKAYFKRANCFRDIGDFKNALKDYEMAIEKEDQYSSNFIDAHYNIAQIYMQLNDYNNAFNHFKICADCGDLQSTQNLLSLQRHLKL